MRRPLASLLLLTLLGTPTLALAAPVDRALVLQRGGAKVETPLGEAVRYRLEGAPEGGTLVTLEQTEDHRLVVSSAGLEGNARIVLATDRQFAVWSVRVEGEALLPSPEAEAAARAACPDLELDAARLSASVKDAPCLEALLPLTALREASGVRLSWNEAGLRAQLSRYEQALAALPDAASLRLRYVGAELRVEGVLTNAASLDALRLALFDASAGPLRLDLSKLELAR
ncbi:MAG: hypothetical protein P1V51_12385 [Deltaproteobacteria bacterium]|nr:hypothetical protein [Deltaproteobacteria bacterium]